MRYLPDLLGGLVVTLELTVLSFLGALVLGTLLGVARVSPVRSLRAFGAAYVGALRNVPLLVLLVLFVFGLPDVGVTYSLFTSAVICLALYAAAFVCETVRSGIRTVPLGQAEAARSIGLTFGQALRHVILPQAFRAMVQPLANVFIGVVLGTSLVAAVGVADLTNRGSALTLRYDEPLIVFAWATAFYVVITLGSGVLAGRLERAVRINR
ncbi:amino acid ABC transporter permease [Actinoplanes palleronii]|uniref:Amino acid ABC transporter permease n=1 Tax=Actinoplanes palleronii TaxID=113570 RepID=A0ABQ4BNK2_9ACTN|nr:amino acid ABC transporter permease [Actinoplanes palleronii]GIE72263.1 amino acid ABC transporter permease [Actinoplanes palleronii]